MAEYERGRWQQIERLYHEVLDCDEADREAFLTSACGGDEALHQELRSLLGMQQAADAFLAEPAIAEAARLFARTSRPSLTGRQISDYDIGPLVGAGGMGEVYRARDRRLRRDVALKVLEPTIAGDPEYRQRFEREAQSASALNHPNIVTIYTVGEADDVTFITMELVQGETLRELMGARMSLQNILDVAGQVASALTAAHALGIVHRDLKPENIMMTREGLVKVLDFGIARRDGSPDETGPTFGTVGYMSPEQVLGQPVGPASDQFAFGAILYEMLSGHHPFQCESKTETLKAIINAQPATLDARVPTSVRAVVSRCLSQMPAARYPTARDLEAAIRRVRDEVRQQPTRRQLLWAGAGVVCAGVAGAATWMLWPPRTLAVLPFANAGRDEGVDYLCSGLAESLIARINQLPIAVKSFSLVSNFARSDENPRTIGEQLGVDTVVAGSVAVDAGHLLVAAELIEVATGRSLWKQRYNRLKTSFFKLWDELATAIIDDGLQLRLTRDERQALLSRPTNDVEAFDLFLQARPYQMGISEEDYLDARRLLQSAVRLDPRFAEAWVALAGTYWTSVLDNFTGPDEAWKEVDHCLETATRLNPHLPGLRFGRATKIFFSDWNWRAAHREWALAEQAPDRDIQPELLNVHALAEWALGDSREALRLVKRARFVDPLSPGFILREASFLVVADRPDEAATLCQSVIKTNPENPAAYFTLADVRRAQRRFDEAIAARRKAHELRGDADDELDAILAEAVGEAGYAEIESTAVRRLELRTLRRRALEDAYASPLDFARAYAQMDDADQAFMWLEQAWHQRSPGLVFLNVDRAWNLIRADPRFVTYVRRVGLPS